MAAPVEYRWGAARKAALLRSGKRRAKCTVHLHCALVHMRTLGTLVFSVPSIRYGISPWLDAVRGKKRPEFPSFRGVITHPVVIVGGGMAGAMTAYACASAGLKVILLEADRVGLGGTGNATGLMSGESSESYREVEARAGRRVARALFSALEAAPRDLAATVKRLGIKAQLEAAPAVRIVPPAQSDQALRKDIAARDRADLIGSYLPPGAVARQAALESSGGMRLPDGGFADPYKLTLGFLNAAIKRGAKVYERSRVKKITFTRKTATAFLDAGSITTTNLVICIGEPTSLFKPLKRHLRHEHRYAVLTEPLPAAVRKELGQRATMLLRDTETPPHHLWFTADHRALFAGGDQKRQPDRLREQDAGAADRRVDVRADAAVSGDFRRGAGVWLGRAARARGGRRALCRLASQFSVSPVRVRHAARPGARVSGQPHHPAQHPRQAGEGRHALFVCEEPVTARDQDPGIRRGAPSWLTSGVFRINPLQGWQREAILKAAQLLRDRFGNPPAEPAGA